VELDEDLRELAAEHGKTIVRVPVPHDAGKLTAALADLVSPFLAGGSSAPASCGGNGPPLVPCLCRPGPGAFCLNGARIA
jgi:hypothetical protein